MKKVLGILFLGVMHITTSYAMGLEQSEYIISSNSAEVKIHVGGKVICGQFDEEVFQAGACNAVSFTFPDENTFNALRNHLPGTLEISVHKVNERIYTILLYSHENDKFARYDLDFTPEE